jgi:hypothetical protein
MCETKLSLKVTLVHRESSGERTGDPDTGAPLHSSRSGDVIMSGELSWSLYFIFETD